MALGDPRVAYYAAGVLAWAQLQKQENFTADDPSSWRLEDGETDPYGEHGHYLPNATLLGLGLEYLVELGVLAKVIDRYGPDMYSQLNRYGALRSLAEAFPNSPFEHTTALASVG